MKRIGKLFVKLGLLMLRRENGFFLELGEDLWSFKVVKPKHYKTKMSSAAYWEEQREHWTNECIDISGLEERDPEVEDDTV